MDALYHKVADKWKMIGLYLEIPKGKLEGITEKYHSDPQRCLVEMFEIWLEQLHPPPTWPNIIATVEFLGEGQLGKELRGKYTENYYSLQMWPLLTYHNIIMYHVYLQLHLLGLGNCNIESQTDHCQLLC